MHRRLIALVTSLLISFSFIPSYASYSSDEERLAELTRRRSDLLRVEERIAENENSLLAATISLAEFSAQFSQAQTAAILPAQILYRLENRNRSQLLPFPSSNISSFPKKRHILKNILKRALYARQQAGLNLELARHRIRNLEEEGATAASTKNLLLGELDDLRTTLP